MENWALKDAPFRACQFSILSQFPVLPPPGAPAGFTILPFCHFYHFRALVGRTIFTIRIDPPACFYIFTLSAPSVLLFAILPILFHNPPKGARREVVPF